MIQLISEVITKYRSPQRMRTCIASWAEANLNSAALYVYLACTAYRSVYHEMHPYNDNDNDNCNFKPMAFALVSVVIAHFVAVHRPISAQLFMVWPQNHLDVCAWSVFFIFMFLFCVWKCSPHCDHQRPFQPIFCLKEIDVSRRWR